MQKITPFLWFDGNAEEAVQFYLSVFKDRKIHSTTQFPGGSPGDNQPGAVITSRLLTFNARRRSAFRRP